MGENRSEYTLIFITSQNLLYEIDFERFYLKKNETIFIKEPKNLY